MFCIKCGTQLPDNAAFCFECGNKVEKAPEIEIQQVQEPVVLMDEVQQVQEPVELPDEVQQAQDVEVIVPEVEIVDMMAEPVVAKPKMGKKKLAIIAAAAVAVLAIVLIICIPSKFKRVKNECVHIAGMITGSGDYFMIDTYPDEYENMDSSMQALLLPRAQENALEAIKYANKELGFNGSVYSQMMETSAIMGRQSEDNGKYKVSWTYHPDDGLEVTYEKK